MPGQAAAHEHVVDHDVRPGVDEDGGQHISGIVFQCLNDVGFTIPAQGVTYWNGEAMHSTDFKDLGKTPAAIASATATAAANAAHLARLLRSQNHPPAK